MSYLGFCDYIARRAGDAPSYCNGNIANPILARLRALQLRRKGRRQELDVQHHLLTRSGRLAVRSKGRPQQSLVDEKVEGKGRFCTRVHQRGREESASSSGESQSVNVRKGTALESEERCSTLCEKPQTRPNEEYQCHRVLSSCAIPAPPARQALCRAVRRKTSSASRKRRERDEPFSRTLLMSSERWKRLQLAGTRNLAGGMV